VAHAPPDWPMGYGPDFPTPETFRVAHFHPFMSPPANLSITLPDSPPLVTEPSDPDGEDPTTPKASSQPPQLNLIPESPTSTTSMPPPPIPSRSNKNTMLAPSVSTLPPQQRPRQKVVLAPGFSPLDWARLKYSGTDLRVSNPSTPGLTIRKLRRRIYCGFLRQNLNVIVVGTMLG